MNTIVKQRVSLTKEQMERIVQLTTQSVPLTDIDFQIIAVIKPTLTKMECGAIRPSSVSKPRQSIAVELGLISALPQRKRSMNELYETWQLDATSLTAEELYEVQMYMYENGMMTPEQERSWEISQGAPAGIPVG